MSETLLAPVPSRTLSGQIYDAIKLDILRGALAPGSALLTRDLLERYGCGISPLREALARLVGEDLLAASDHRGVRVPLPSVSDVQDVYRIRIALEREALALALVQGDDAWEGSILAAGHLLEKTPIPDAGRNDSPAVEAWEARHRAFHTSLIAAAPAPRLLRLIGQMVDHTERYRMLRLKHVDRSSLSRSVVDEHRELKQAVVARDQACLDLLAAHLQRTCDIVVAILQSSVRSPQ
ncbi:MAG TPA: FCD domain-containing protein [Xanthobacteraceae bacterium]|nr:FCD domain-containing protein [Xanthobacteraceae bacterium]